MKPAYQTVIFDIDGTLLKSDRGVMNAPEVILRRKWECPILRQKSGKKFIGPPLHYNFHDLMGMNEADTARAIDLFNEYYRLSAYLSRSSIPESWSWSPAFSTRERGCIATAKSKPMADRVVGLILG